MAERRRTEAVDEAEVLAHVEAAADELYALAPDEFSSARDDLVRQAREQRNQPLARELGKLRKPTLSAWLINLLWRDQRQVMEQLFDLAAELSQAQTEASGTALRELTAQRRDLETALMRHAAALAQQAGVRVADSVVREAQETLNAALALPEVAGEVRSGRLTRAASYAGFGVLPTTAPKRPTAPEPPAEPIDLRAALRARDERTAAEARELARRREAAERRQAAERKVEEARGALTTANETLREHTRVADAARRHQLD